MIRGLLGRKMGIIQVFDKNDRLRGATVIETGPCLITQIRNEERDGYAAVQLGFAAAKHVNKPMRGHLQRQGDLRYLREFPVDDPSEHKIGDRLGAEMFQEGDRVDVTGTSKGRGFAGVVKRHGFAGGPKTHGQSDRHRAPGSIGAGNTPGRTFKGMRMGGHMGSEKVTIRNLEVLQSDPARGLLIVAGSVPGATNGLLKIRYSAQTLDAARKREPAESEDASASAEEQPKSEVPAGEPTAEPEDNSGGGDESSSGEDGD